MAMRLADRDGSGGRRAHAAAAEAAPAGSAADGDAPAVRELRDAFGCFATGVAVVTIGGDGRRLGMTVNSIASVSLEPPLLLWCLARDCDEFAAFHAAPRFAVSVLAADQQDLSRRFAAGGGDRFAVVPTRAGGGVAPLIDGAVAWFECRAAHRYPGGDHVIVVGRIERFGCGPGAPLVYHRSRYGTVAG